MIRLISEPSELILDKSCYSGRIYAACKAYGTGYDFCRFYSSDNGSLLIYNSSAVISGCPENIGELRAFIEINAPNTVECPASLGEKLSLSGYEKRHRTLWEKKDIPKEQSSCENASLMKMYEIVSKAFGETAFDLWYADMSHRIRHGISKAYIYKNAACACVDFVFEGAGYISQVAVMPSERGKGYGRKIADIVSGELSAEGAAARLWAYDDMAGFYRSLGFTAVCEDFIYII
jgi:ribosomal protein S18 acetylase RimI-like enzyme